MRFVLIGEGALAVRCVQALLSRGGELSLLCSPDGSLADTAAACGVAHTRDRAAFRQGLADARPEVLLSVSNPWVLRADELTCVEGVALNYHDSPLPAHAGMHATSWALMQGDSRHGITWHEVTAGIDAGRVVAQVNVPIHEDDTAFTLNTRCFDAAFAAFQLVLDQLRPGALVMRPQVGTRSYHPARQRVDAQCAMDARLDAASVVRMVRAHDFGLGHNPLGLPKLWLGGERWWLVKSACVARQGRTIAAGQLAPVVPNGVPPSGGAPQLLWGARGGNVALGGLCELDGTPVRSEDMQEVLTRQASCPLPQLSDVQRLALRQLHEDGALTERAWRQVLSRGVSPLRVPGWTASTEGGRTVATLPELNAALASLPPSDRHAWALACWALYALRLGREQEGDLGLLHPRALADGLGLFAKVLPCRLTLQPDESFAHWVQRCAGAWTELRSQGTFALDLLRRCPEWPPVGGWPGSWPVAVWEGELPADIDATAAWPADWVLCLPSDASAVSAVGPGGVASAQPWARIDVHLATLLQAARARPDEAVSALPILDATERAHLMACARGPRADVPAVPMHTLVQAQADRNPTALAASHGEATLTYEALINRSRALARVLRSNGVATGSKVGLCVRRGLDALVGMVGIMASGGVYVPLDPEHPAERLVGMLDAAGVQLVVVHAGTRGCLAELGRSGIDMSEALSPTPSQVTDLAWPDVQPDDLAYCIFTSGSTGVPKGVEVTHRALVNHAWAVRDVYHLEPSARCLLSASIGFDVAAEQIFPALVSGAQVVVRPDDLLTSVGRFHRFVQDQGLTALTLPTAWWQEWVRHLHTHRLQVPASLRAVGVGTEKVLCQPLAQWRQMGGRGVRFVQGYGPTEATITCTMHVLDPGEDWADGVALPIGRPLANTEVHVLDAQGGLMPWGAEGEICVGGVGLARGYVGQPGLTRQVFVPHPLAPESGARLYRTGDRGHWNAQGQLCIVGRKDFQVKLRGHRVELGDIEAAIRRLSGVQSCVVTVREDQPDMRQLVAYVVPEPGGPGPDAVQAWCRQVLPEHMVPQAVVPLSRLPTNLHGKVDRQALPAPEAPEVHSADAWTCRDDIEVVVARLFAQVLGRASVPLDHSYFDLGGDSLGAMRLIGQLESALSVSVALGDLFAAPSVRALAERIRQGGEGHVPVVLQWGQGAGTPIWFLGGVLQYEALASALAGAHPVYVVLLPVEEALIRHGAPLPSLDAIAEQYLAAIVQRMPSGPYAVGGFSMGGAIAYEVGRKLLQRGQEVDQLIMFDTTLPGALGPGTGRRGAAAWLTRQWHAWRSQGWRVLAARAARLQARWAKRRRGEGLDPERQRMADRRMAEYVRVLSEFEAGLQPYPGAVVTYRATGEDATRSVKPGMGFAGMVQGAWVEVPVPADHMAMMDPPHAQRMAADLIARLGATRRTASLHPLARQAA